MTKDSFVSLADQIINQATTITPTSRTAKLASKSLGELIAHPEDSRDLAWMAQVIKQSPAYNLAPPVAEAIDELWNVFDGGDVKGRRRAVMAEILAAGAKTPELFVPAQPYMWTEWQDQETMKLGGKVVRHGLLVTPRSDGKAGFYASIFDLRDGELSSIGTKEMQAFSLHAGSLTPYGSFIGLRSRFLPKKDQQRSLDNAEELSILTAGMVLTHLAIIKNEKFVTAVQPSSEIFEGKPLGLISLNQSTNTTPESANSGLAGRDGSLPGRIRKAIGSTLANIFNVVPAAESKTAVEAQNFIAMAANRGLLPLLADADEGSKLVSLPRVTPSLAELYIKSVTRRDTPTTAAASPGQPGPTEPSTVAELVAVPLAARGKNWLAATIKASPGFVIEHDLATAALGIGSKLAIRDSTRNHPKLVAPKFLQLPVPTMWLELPSNDVTDNSSPMGLLLENVREGDKWGVRVVQVTSGRGVIHGPTATHPMISSTSLITPAGLETVSRHIHREDSSITTQDDALDQVRFEAAAIIAHQVAKQLLRTFKSESHLAVLPPAANGDGQITLPRLTLDSARRPTSDRVPSGMEDFLGHDIIELFQPSRSKVPPKPPAIAALPTPLADPVPSVTPDVGALRPTAITLNGTVVQRIFREAAKSHPQMAPERKDDIARMQSLTERLRMVASLESMNANFSPHAELASALFSDEVMRRLEYAHLNPLTGKEKVPALAADMQGKIVTSLQRVVAIDDTTADVAAEDVARNTLLKQRIAAFPELVVVVLGDDASMRQLRNRWVLPYSNTQNAEERPEPAKLDAARASLDEHARQLTTAAGINLPSLPVASIVQANLADASTEMTAAVAPVAPAPEPTLSTAPDLTPLESREVILPPPITAGSADVPAATTAPYLPTVLSNRPVAGRYNALNALSMPPRLLTDDEIIEQAIKRDDARAETLQQLLGDAQLYLLQAQNQGLNMFESRIDLQKPGFAIQLHFSREDDVDGERKVRRTSYGLEKYDRAFVNRGIPLTLDDAVDLKISVQSMIRNTPGITTPHELVSAGLRAVELDTQMPLPVMDFKFIERSGGMYTLILKAIDPYTRQGVQPSIPLGMAARHEDEAAEHHERNQRGAFVLDYLEEIGRTRSPEGHRVFVTKRDVMLKLQSHLEAEGKEWETAEQVKLPGFEENTELHVSATGNQRIVLAPVTLRMDIGGDNPSWHAELRFYCGDKTKPSQGDLIRSRSLNLQTRDRSLAIARTRESLLGREKVPAFQGFLPGVQNYSRSTGYDWKVVEHEKMQGEAFIGPTPLQHFLDDMMRYDRDIGVRLEKREPGGLDGVVITLQAVRSLTGDYDDTVHAVPEAVHESTPDGRKPTAYKLVVPTALADRIEVFVASVHDHIRWHADEAYSSRSLGTHERPDKRQDPLIYRTAQIRLGLIRAVEALYATHFGRELPKDWHRPEAQATIGESGAAGAPNRVYDDQHLGRAAPPPTVAG